MFERKDVVAKCSHTASECKHHLGLCVSEYKRQHTPSYVRWAFFCLASRHGEDEQNKDV